MINSKFALKKQLIKSSTKIIWNYENPDVKKRTKNIFFSVYNSVKALDSF